MTISELIQEFIFDCEVRELSARTTHNYEKQLKQFEAYLCGSCAVERLDDLKSVNIKQFVPYFIWFKKRVFQHPRPSTSI